MIVTTSCRRCASVLAIAGALAVAAGTSGAQGPAEAPTVLSDPPPRTHNRQLTTFTEAGRTGFRLDEREGEGVAWWPDTVLGSGTIELDIRGQDVQQRSFVGVAFSGVDEETYEAVYFRPFNFRAEDDARRVRAVQYVSHPDHPWMVLRKQHPGVFERGVTPPPDPNAWFHVRVVIDDGSVRVYVGDATSPALEVKRLTDRRRGWVGLWVGNGSGGDFANVRVHRAAGVSQGE